VESFSGKQNMRKSSPKMATAYRRDRWCWPGSETSPGAETRFVRALQECGLAITGPLDPLSTYQLTAATAFRDVRHVIRGQWERMRPRILRTDAAHTATPPQTEPAP